ncbi:MAG: hypothetical protein K2X38_08730 [Gemmataceae bacterium]|nr:hypothetical protein [Gemmataceae bacterium]
MTRLKIASIKLGLPRGNGILVFEEAIPPLIVDRAYLKRFQPRKDGWFILTDANEASYEPPMEPQPLLVTIKSGMLTVHSPR